MTGARNFQGNMAKYMNKNPYTTQREHNAFLRELRQFHESRGTSFRKNPCLNGHEINLSQLYNEVTNLGGWRKVNESQKWDIILQSLGIPKACANANLALKQFYIRYLDHYEKIHFLGEDPDDDAVDSGENPARKSHNMTFLVPLSYNHQQHEVSDAMRTQACLADIINVSDYEKLMLSLKSGLPNEVDFALNVCTLLSNEGKHTLHLEKAPHLIDLLVSHAGVWTESNKSLKELLEERWSKVEGRQMAKFWNDTVEDKEIRDIYLSELKGNENSDKDLFQFSRQLGVREMEGQRVLQIAMILWNLSFEENNMPVLASSPTCLKFLFLCIHCNWACLCQMGLDTLGNIAAEINLDPMDCLNLQVMFRTISRSLLSSDRFLMIRGLEILASLCKVEANEEKIIKHLDKMLYEKICSLLTIHDIMLLIYTLECLYYLTDLGHDICNNIVQIHKIIEVLVSLITVEAQSFGPSACIAMKVVETSVPAPLPTPVPINQRPQPTPSPANSTKTVSQSTTVVHGYQEADNDTFAYNWLKAYYEWSPSSSLLQNELYVDYQTTCNKLGKKGLVPPSQLLNLLKSLYPQIKTRPSNSQNYRSEIHLDGIKRRTVTLPVSIYMPTRGNVINNSVTSVSSSVIQRNSNILSPLSSSNSTLSGSPILKAQLSAPPRPQPNSAVSHHPHLQQALLGRSQPSAIQPTAATPPSTPPHNIISTKDSTLIKSLLANKVSQNMLLRQQQQQHVQTIVTTSGNSLTTTTESSNTVSSLSSTSSSSSSSPISTPCSETLNQKAVTTKIVSSGSNTIISSVFCTKDSPASNPSIRPRSPKSRINGAPRTIQLEVCSRLEVTKDVENKESQEVRKERMESIHCISGEIAEKHKNDDLMDNNEPTLDKLLRGNTMALQNGLSTAQNGNRSENDSPKLLTMEASPLLGLNDQPIRRKGVLADLLEGRVHKDALLSMNGIIDRSEHLSEISGNINNPIISTSTSSCTSTISVTCSSSTTIQTNSTVTSIAIVGNNCNSVFAVKTTPLLNGEGLVAKPVKVVLPCDSQRTANVTLKETSRLEVPETSRACVNGNSESVRMGNESTSVPTIPTEWTSSPSASKVIVPPKSIETEELIGFPRVSLEQLNQLRQKAESLRATNKRPSNEPSSLSDIKRLRMEERLTSSSSSTPSLTSSSSSSSTSSTLSSSSSSSTLSLPIMHTAVLMDSKGNRLDEKFSPLPILTPSEAQQQVSAVLQGSFTEKPSHASLSDKNSSQKFVSNELIKTQPHSQPKLAPKTEVQNITKNSGMVTSRTERKNSAETIKEEIKTISRIDSNSTKISVASLSSSSLSSSPPPSPASSSSSSKKLEYICEWKDCLKSFESPMAVFVHACKAHAPEGSINIPCLWEGCDHMSRQRLSLMTHLQDRHCNDHMLRLQATRRQQLAQMGSSTIPPPVSPLPHPGYAPNAAVQAIRRHALEFIANKELTDEKEGPVTKSIRLTAALILRNLIMYSSIAKSLAKKYEAHLSMIAMSNVESSRTVAQCLWELNRQQESRVR